MRRHQVGRAAAALLLAAGCDLAAGITTAAAPYGRTNGQRQRQQALGLLAKDRRRAAEQPSEDEDWPVDLADPDHIPAGLARRTGNCLHRVALPQDADPLSTQRAMTRWPNETKRMRDLETIGWREIRASPYVSIAPKLALMMFTSTRVNNEQVWLNWLRRAQDDGLEVKMMIHSKDLGNIQDFQSKGLIQYVQRSSVSLEWCNMWGAQMMLMRRALEDPHVSHVMVLSRDSIPVKPLSYIYRELAQDPATRMCADNNWRGKGGTPRAESWWMMRREDAELFTDNSLFARRNFLSHAEGCADEQAWYYPLKMREETDGRTVVRDECVMFADWADGTKACKDWGAAVDSCRTCRELRGGTNRTEANNAHPVSFRDVNRSALQGLIASPFWFARKFNDGAIRPDAAELLS